MIAKKPPNICFLTRRHLELRFYRFLLSGELANASVTMVKEKHPKYRHVGNLMCFQQGRSARDTLHMLSHESIKNVDRNLEI